MDVHLTCTHCDELIESRDGNRFLHCQKCGTEHKLSGHLCPACHNYSETETAVCSQCGEATTRLCSNCNAVNWSGDESCRQCGTSLDILEYLQQHTPKGRQERLRDQMHSAGYFKGIEETGSKKRMAEFNAMEDERQVDLSRNLENLRRRERKMLLFVFSALAGLLIFVILFIILN